MISHEEIKGLVPEWGIREDVVEKDYVIGWLLWGIGAQLELQRQWVFKGGTCLKKCFFETYRFSEDLDFTVLPGGPVEPGPVEPLVRDVLKAVADASGINFSVKEPLFRKRTEDLSAEVRVYYQGPRMNPSPASVKFDLSGREKVVAAPVMRAITHPYSDSDSAGGQVQCYSLEELFAEKIRALAERCRPRDLYDVVNIHRRVADQVSAEAVRAILSAKCMAKGIAVPAAALAQDMKARQELDAEWQNMLGHQLPELPPPDNYWRDLGGLFAWLEGQAPAIRQLACAPADRDEDAVWRPPPTLSAWHANVPIETIRFAAANQLCVEMVYVDRNGDVSHRLIEPYSLRRTSEGNLVLHTMDAAKREHRSFRIDRIRSVKVTSQAFTPSYVIELSATGSLSIPPATRTVRRHSPRPLRQSRSGVIYIVECTYCRRRFRRKDRDTTLREHKDKNGYRCSGRHGYIVDQQWQ